jgi:hypothetical protein
MLDGFFLSFLLDKDLQYGYTDIYGLIMIKTKERLYA